jgi:very-short-patch-repair endonuclease
LQSTASAGFDPDTNRQQEVAVESYRKDLKKLARNLRSNMTDAEQALWWELRGKRLHGMRFYRQKPLMDFIVDFYCPRAGLVVEPDGSQHLEREHMDRDRWRDGCLRTLGLNVLRFSNREVLMEREAVLAAIEEKMIPKVLK